jgi:hypothetical protein
MKRLAFLALAVVAFVLSAVSSTAGTARVTGPRLLGLSPLAPHAHRLAQARHMPRQTTRPHRFDCVASCTAYETTINQYFTDVATAGAAAATDNVYSVLPEYANPNWNVTYSTSFAADTNSYVDANPLPTTHTCHDGFNSYCVTDKQLQAEIAKVVAKQGWPTGTTTDLYFIFTPANVGVCERQGSVHYNNCTTNSFCAYHSITSKFIYAVEPDALAQNGGCDTGEAPAGNGADSTLSTISHEQIEAVTDPYGDGWWTEDPETWRGYPLVFYHSEIGDLCAWNFGTPLGGTPGTFFTDGTQWNQVINGHDYYLQQQWSNADAGCVQHAGGTVTNFAPNDNLYDGTGPLVDHGGSLMTSTTVYAIYWVPAAPVGDTHLPPRIKGATQVGKKLKAFHGNWTYGLTYAYRWLRCSAAGTACKPIKKANDSHYALTPADAGHRIEVHVTAANQAGRASATSVPTAKVRS